MVPAPTTKHQFLAGNVHSLVRAFVHQHGLGAVLCSPIDVVFGAGHAREVVQPDVLFVSNERRAIIAEEEIRGAPDLIVEVLSPSTEARDRTYKKHLYGRYGVREYWIVDPTLEALEVYSSAGADFDNARIYRRRESVSSPLLPGLTIALEEVFELR